MSIEIKLTGEEAETYLNQHTPDTAALAIALKTATEYIDVLEKEKAQQHFTPIDELDTPAVNNDDSGRHNIAGSMNKPDRAAEYNQGPSNRIIKDSEIAEEITPAKTLYTRCFETLIEKSNSSYWTEMELGVIAYAMERPEKELNRKFSEVCRKIGSNRTEAAVRSKLSDMGIYVNSDTLYYK